MRMFRFQAAVTLLLAFREAQGDVVTSKLKVHIPKSLNKPDGYDHREALFGIPPYGGSIQAQVYFADADLCTNNVDTTIGFPARDVDPVTQKMKPWVPPYILLVDRGSCTFVQKVRNAQRAGAAGVLIADNACLCSFPDCKPENADEPCEVQEPIMADDGSGNDISIPSFLMFKQDADPIKNALKTNQHVSIEMAFSIPSPNARVDYSLWTTPVDELSLPIQSSFKEAAVALGDKASFTPHMYIYDGVRAGCDQEGINECYNLCTNNGRYCAVDPDDDLDSGLSGADVVTESLRRICVWDNYGATDGVGKEYWTYVDEFNFRCGGANRTDFFTDDKCIADAMTHAGVDKTKVDQCMADSGGLEGDVPNKELDKQIADKEASGVVLIPTLFVNQAPIRGQLSFATAFKAICAGYASGYEPKVCTTCANCNDEAGCVQKAKCTAGMSLSANGGVSVNMFGSVVGGITLFFVIFGFIIYKRQQRQMRDQVRGILAEYMPLDVNQKNNQPDNTVGIDETDAAESSEFTIS